MVTARFARLFAALLVPALLGAAPAEPRPAGFLPGWSAPEGAETHKVALGDVDGDGDLDAYVSDWYSTDVLWLNDGDGGFTVSPNAQGTGFSSCVEFAPFDAGASLDLFRARHLSSNRVALNDGSGLFTDTGQAIGNSTSRGGCAVGDLDGDDDLDVYVATDTISSSNEIFWNDGAGGFTDSGQSLGSYFSRAVALGDVDGDDDLDAMIGNNGPNKLWMNDGAGAFTDSGATVGSEGTFDVALGDLDGDDDLDAFFANGSTSGDPEEVWLNDGAGVFSDSGQNLGDDYSFTVELFDADGDDDLDAFVGNNVGVENRLYLNDGDALFTDSGQALGLGGVYGSAAGDVDGDDDVDLYLANATQPDQVFFNDGGGVFAASGQLLGSSAAESVAVGDVDGDGDADAVVGTYGGIVRLFRNDGDGGFTDDDQWLSPGDGPTAGAVALADFDGDGDLDAWVGFCCVGSGWSDDPEDRLYWNDGAGHFSDSGQLFGSDYTTAAVAGDFDQDGDLDVAVSNFASIWSNGANRLYRNDGAGNFTQGPQALGSGGHSSLATADLDGDDDLDLLIGKRSGGGAQVYRNGGGGGMTATPNPLGSADVTAVALADLDGDGDRDAIVGTAAGDEIWLNAGNATFTDSSQALGTTWTDSIHPFDADGDDDLDLWITQAGLGCEPNLVFLNDGAGLFTDSGWSLGCTIAGQSALADLDGDGDPDLLRASFSGDHAVWLNQLSAPIFSDGFESGSTTSWSSVVP